MTLDEAIKHCEEVAYQKDMESGFETDNERYAMTDKERTACKECAKEHKQLAEWLKELKQFKEQEHCEDAVSRASVFEIMGNLMGIPYECDRQITEKDVSESMDEIRNLPSVTPTKCIATVKFSKEDMQELINEKMKDIVVERKKGKWINKSQKSGCGITFVASECTCCGKKTLFNCDELLYRYCPNCGAEMESEE